MALTAAIVQIAQAGVQRGRNPGATPAQPQKFLTVGERHEEPHGYWCWRDESNVRPTDYESVALPTELRQLFYLAWNYKRNSPLAGLAKTG